MRTTTISSFGDVVLVTFPFTNQSATKQRPAAVISSKAYHRQRPDLILLAITSQVRTPLRVGEAIISDWQSAGLIKPSTFKPIIFTAEKSIVRKTLGTLIDADQKILRKVLSDIVG